MTYKTLYRFISETVFISQQIGEYRFGALLEISDKFTTKIKGFSQMIFQFRLKTGQFHNNTV